MNPLGEPRFLTLLEVLTLHETAIDEHGGSHGIRDQGLLESALAMPRQGFGDQYANEFPFGMAAAYAFHICKNHPFVDGNKRTAFAAMVVFLRMNGWSLTADEEAAASRIIEMATDVMDKEKLAGWLAANTRPRPSLELRKFLGQLNYTQLADAFSAIDASDRTPEFIQTALEAGASIPAITEALIGAMDVEARGNEQSAFILRRHAMLLIALYRIAEDMGYEW